MLRYFSLDQNGFTELETDDNPTAEKQLNKGQLCMCSHTVSCIWFETYTVFSRISGDIQQKPRTEKTNNNVYKKQEQTVTYTVINYHFTIIFSYHYI